MEIVSSEAEAVMYEKHHIAEHKERRSAGPAPAERLSLCSAGPQQPLISLLTRVLPLVQESSSGWVYGQQGPDQVCQ